MSEKVLSESEKKKEDWMNSKWRPMMGWMYMLVCTTDFVLFPVLWSLIQAMAGGQVHSQWQPITLQGAGLFHIAMGAVLGIAAFGRTQEKLGGANNGGLQPVAQSVTTTFGSPSPGFGAASGGFGSPAASGGFGSPAASGGFGSPAASGGFGGARATPSFGGGQMGGGTFTTASGKAGPIPPQDPEL